MAPILQYSQFKLDRIHPHANIIEIAYANSINLEQNTTYTLNHICLTANYTTKEKAEILRHYILVTLCFLVASLVLIFHISMIKEKYIRFQFRFFNPIKAGRGGVWRPPCSFFALVLSFVTLSP